MDSSKPMTEMEALKKKLSATWKAGDFGEIAATYADGAADFVNKLDVLAGSQVLDVACGTGNQSIPAAKLGASVTGVDIAENLIEQARTSAENEGLNIRFDVGDAEALPYEDRSFDAVISMFGTMFAPRPDVIVSELQRVCRPGGLIALANWTPEGFIGQMFKTTGKHVTPAPGMPSPLLWGVEDTVRERLGSKVSLLAMTRRPIDFVLPFGPEETVEHFRLYYGPTQKAFDALDSNGQAALRLDLNELWAANNVATDGTTRVTSEYLEILAIRTEN